MARKRTPRKAVIGSRAAEADRWRMSDLPASDQAELRDRLAQARRGEALIDFDEAMRIARRATTRILKTASTAVTQRSNR